MCIVFVALQAHRRWSVVVAANRDEFVTRAADRVAQWECPHKLLGGRDAVAGGTWMGVNTDDGRWAALVNVAPPLGLPVGEGAPSRGTLPTQYLTSGSAAEPARFAQEISMDPRTRSMAGHTLLVGSRGGCAAYVCNRGDAEGGGCRELQPGDIVALSNDAVTSHSDSCWAKASRGKALLADILNSDGDRDGQGLADLLLDMLTDEHKDVAPAKRHGYTPGGERSGAAFTEYSSAHPERPEIPIFIAPPAEFRTRCSTVLLVERESQNMFYVERSHDDGSEPSHIPGTRSFFLAGTGKGSVVGGGGGGTTPATGTSRL